MTAQMTSPTLTVDHKDKQYVFHPLRDCDFGKFEMWAQDRYISVTKRNISDLPTEQQTLLLMNAFEKAALITFSSKECATLMKTIEGSALLLQLSLRDAYTLDEIRQLTTDKEFLASAFDKIMLLSKVENKPPVSEKQKKKGK